MSANTTLLFLANFDGLNPKTGRSCLDSLQFLIDQMDAEVTKQSSTPKKDCSIIEGGLGTNVKLPVCGNNIPITASQSKHSGEQLLAAVSDELTKETHHSKDRRLDMGHNSAGNNNNNGVKSEETEKVLNDNINGSKHHLVSLLRRRSKYTALPYIASGINTSNMNVVGREDRLTQEVPRRHSVTIGGRSPYSHIAAMQRTMNKRPQGKNLVRRRLSEPWEYSNGECRRDSSNGDDSDITPKHDYIDRWLEKLYFRRPIVVPGALVANGHLMNKKPPTTYGRMNRPLGTSDKYSLDRMNDSQNDSGHTFTSIVNVCEMLPPRPTSVSAHSLIDNINDNNVLQKTSRQHRQLMAARCEVFAEKVTEILRSGSSIVSDTYSSLSHPEEHRPHNIEAYKDPVRGYSTPNRYRQTEELCDDTSLDMNTTQQQNEDNCDGEDITYITVSPVRMSHILHENGLIPGKDDISNKGVMYVQTPNRCSSAGQGNGSLGDITKQRNTNTNTNRSIPTRCTSAQNRGKESVNFAIEVARKIVDSQHDRNRREQ